MMHRALRCFTSAWPSSPAGARFCYGPPAAQPATADLAATLRVRRYPPDRMGRGGLLMAAIMPVRQRLRVLKDAGPLPWVRRHGPGISKLHKLLKSLRTGSNESLDGLQSIPLGGVKS